MDGVKVNAPYFMQFNFPKYRIREEPLYPSNNLSYKEYTLEDFEYIRKAGRRVDLVFGGVFNGFMGNAGKHLGVGGA
ncbi:hypothetical protein AHMF7605_12980 [Adhaeribacter arboris]|uniref:Uncharacterized protein n=1 Tax=Adhaeribacter arboris TaxID=2072846 RepID=A0A2T2YFS1_9BACT|nr:hypothetical protein AHMF7605_12980 [Adhaeribacter arboris]